MQKEGPQKYPQVQAKSQITGVEEPSVLRRKTQKAFVLTELRLPAHTTPAREPSLASLIKEVFQRQQQP